MIIKLQLFGASREFSNEEHIDLKLHNKASIKDLRNKIIDYLKINFKGNEDFIKIVNSSVFCSEDNQIINNNFKITKDQKIGIIPPIGGG
jgi:molybdopterin synthase sulfur carrier subunit